MPGRKQELRVTLHQILDALLVAFAVWLAWKLRTFETGTRWIERWLGRWSEGFAFPPVQPFDSFVWLLFVLMPALPLVLDYLGFYDPRHQPRAGKVLRQLLAAIAVVLLVVGAATIFFRTAVDSRLVLGMALLLAISLLFARNRATRWVDGRLSLRREDFERVLIAGHPEDIRSFRGEFDEIEQRVAVVGGFDLIGGTLDEFVQLLHREAIERVFFCGDHLHFKRMEDAVRTCELEGVEAWVSTRFLRAGTAEPSFDQFADHPMLVLRGSPDHGWWLLLKALIDRLGAFCLLLATCWIWPLVWIGIRRSDPGPILFRQERGGKHGKSFTMFKFRSMYQDAEARREELLERNTMSGPVFKVDEDPRIFPFGHFLRRTSLDELPQLLNVLLGQMSLVGPRPLPVYEVEKIVQSRQRRRLSVKPGLTCLWQISGRNEITDFDDWVRLDLEYIDNWSLGLDIRILLRTLPVVLLRQGAR